MFAKLKLYATIAGVALVGLLYLLLGLERGRRKEAERKLGESIARAKAEEAIREQVREAESKGDAEVAASVARARSGDRSHFESE